MVDIVDTPQIRTYIQNVINGIYVPSEHTTIEFVNFLREENYSKGDIKRFVHYFGRGLSNNL